MGAVICQLGLNQEFPNTVILNILICTETTGDLAKRERFQLINQHCPGLLPDLLLARPSALPGTSRSNTNRNSLSGTFGRAGATSIRHKCFCAGPQPMQALGTFISDSK